MKGSIATAEELVRTTPERGDAAAVQEPRQSRNPSPHHRGGNLERYGGNIDFFVAGVGPGGTIPRRPVLKPARRLRIVAVEPRKARCCRRAAFAAQIQGIGAGFIPDILDRSVIDEIVKVNSQTAIETARALARTEGIPGGISSGCRDRGRVRDRQAARQRRQDHFGHRPSFSERYLSTALFEGI